MVLGNRLGALLRSNLDEDGAVGVSVGGPVVTTVESVTSSEASISTTIEDDPSSSFGVSSASILDGSSVSNEGYKDGKSEGILDNSDDPVVGRCDGIRDGTSDGILDNNNDDGVSEGTSDGMSDTTGFSVSVAYAILQYS